MNYKNNILSFVLGATILALGYQVWQNYQYQSALNNFAATYNQDHATLAQIVTFLNNATKPATK